MEIAGDAAILEKEKEVSSQSIMGMANSIEG